MRLNPPLPLRFPPEVSLHPPTAPPWRCQGGGEEEGEGAGGVVHTGVRLGFSPRLQGPYFRGLLRGLHKQRHRPIFPLPPGMVCSPPSLAWWLSLILPPPSLLSLRASTSAAGRVVSRLVVPRAPPGVSQSRFSGYRPY